MRTLKLIFLPLLLFLFFGCSDMMSKYNFREDFFKVGVIIDNDSEFCYVQQVNLRVTFDNIARVRFLEDGKTWSSWMSPQNSYPWTLSYKNGERSITCEAETIYGDILTSTDTIIYYDRVSSGISLMNISTYTFDASPNLNCIVTGVSSGSGNFITVYTRGTNTWIEERVILQQPVTSEFSAVSVNSDGSLFAIGCASNDDKKGAVFLYERISGTWVMQKSFYGSIEGEKLGISVKLSGDSSKLIIGVAGKNTFAGHLELYNRSDNWGTSTLLPPIAKGAYDIYGDFATSLDCNEDASVIVVGEPDFCYSNPAPVYAGKVYVYTDSGGGYAGSILVNPNQTGPSEFGLSVSCDSNGTYAIVGAPGESKAYIFNLSDNSLHETVSVLGLSSSANFGRSVDIASVSGKSLVAVSAHEQTGLRGVRTGAVYLFDRSGTLLETVELKDSQAVDLFGRKVIVGADAKSFSASVPGDDIFTSSDNQGSVYVFRDIIN